MTNEDNEVLIHEIRSEVRKGYVVSWPYLVKEGERIPQEIYIENFRNPRTRKNYVLIRRSDIVSVEGELMHSDQTLEMFLKGRKNPMERAYFRAQERAKEMNVIKGWVIHDLVEEGRKLDEARKELEAERQK